MAAIRKRGSKYEAQIRRKKTKVRTEVEVVSKKVMQTNIFAPDWSGEILSGIDGCLN